MDREIYKFIPHRGRMAIIDKIVANDKESFAVSVSINKDSLLYTEQGVPSYCGIEYMAQTVAAYNTLFIEDNHRAKIGFMAAVRKFEAKISFFEESTELIVRVEPSLIVANSGSFNCLISVDSTVVATARITAYVPTEDELEKLKTERTNNA